MKTMIILFVLAWQGAAGLLFAQKLTLEVRGFEAVSYTHLTLPTNSSV